MSLNTLEGARKELAGLMRTYRKDEIPDTKVRTLGYLFGHLLAFFKTEQDTEILRRLEALEEGSRKQTGQ